jgi:hypothetical protein
MSKLSVIFLAIGLMFSGLANAQFTNLLNQIAKELVKEVEKAVTQSDQVSSALKLPTNNTKVISSQEFCKRLQSSQELKEFSLLSKDLAMNFGANYVFDTKDNLISNWLLNKLKSQLEGGDRIAFNEYIRNTEYAMNQCALEIRDSDLLFMMANDGRAYEMLKKDLDKIAMTRQPQQARQLDSSGNVVAKTQILKSEPFLTIGGESIGQSVPDSRINSRVSPSWIPFANWIPSWLIVLDEKEQIIKSTYPEIKASIIQNIATRKQESDNAKTTYDKEQKDRASSEAAEQKEREESIARYNAYIGSPEGKLTYSYQRFQALQTCNEIRRGYAVQFINDEELSNAKAKIRAIESKLKPLLKDKDTNKLWAQATKRNQEFNPTEGNSFGFDIPLKLDLIATIISNNKGNWIAAKTDCDEMFNQFNIISSEILGQSAPMKNF